MGILHELHEDIGLFVVWIESLILGIVIVLKQDHRVLAFADIHIICKQIPVLVAGLPEDMNGVTVGSGVYGRINVYRDEDIRPCLVGGDSPFIKSDELVVGPGHHDVYIRICIPDECRQARGDVQGKVFLVSFFVFAHRACIFSAVSGIYYYGAELQIVRRGTEYVQHRCQEYADCVFQKIVVLLYFANLEKNCILV